ncbi:MAG: universal stress protein [Desulfurococcales archaeon]|nr:universal stress protein [Desulfurococcales archaeon]
MNTRPLERILVPIDLSPVSDKHIELAGKVAKTYNSELILFHSIDSLVIEHAAAGYDPEKLISALETKARRKLEEYQKQLEEAGVQVEIYDEIPVADPAIAISNAAKRAGATEILLVKKGWRIKRFTLMGGTVKELIKLSTVPLILYHVSYSRKSKEIVVHGEPDFARRLIFSIDKNVSEPLIAYVKELAKTANTEELILLHVIESEESDNMVNELIDKVYKSLHDAVPSVKRAILKSGKTGKLIVKFAESIRGSLVVGRTVHRGVLDWILGSTLDHVILYSTQPIIVYPVVHINE